MTTLIARIDGTTRFLPITSLCDAWLSEGVRFGDELPGLEPGRVLGRWPSELETDALVRLAQAVGDDATWDAIALVPAVAQKLAERARPLPLDLEIARHLQHLQYVCHRPRLHLRVEEERLPVSRTRRIPVRAVAELVSHPGDWEHRTLRSIQPARVLARQVEDEWNLYENRVAVRLVDNLLSYLSKRLEELRKIKEILDASRDHSEEVRRTSFRRARRITLLWSNTLDSRTEGELKRTIDRLELAQRDLQILLDAPLYQRVPRRQSVGLSLEPTNILVNDPHYRKVAALWRAWVRFGHKRQETAPQRTARRQREAAAWDRFVLHLVVRGFAALGWSASRTGDGWALTKTGWSRVRVATTPMGIIRMDGARAARFLPLCADLCGAEPVAIQALVEELDGSGADVVVAHVGTAAPLTDLDRASGWTIGGHAVLFPCSPWGIDSEERMARLLQGWLCRAAAPDYPIATVLHALPDWTERWEWLRKVGGDVVAFRAPTDREAAEAHSWAAAKARELENQAQRARLAQKAFAIAPREDVAAFRRFVDRAAEVLRGLDACPVCGEQGLLEPRPGRSSTGADANWWATCGACGSEWGTRPCTGCGTRFRALVPQSGLGVDAAGSATLDRDWPDKVFGCDLWAQPCRQRPAELFRCPACGKCSGGPCSRCATVDRQSVRGVGAS